MTRVLARCFTALALALLATLALAPAAQAEEFVLKLATVAPDNTPFAEIFKKYKKEVEKASGGRVKVKLLLGGAVGGENESALKAKRGEIQAVGVSTGAMATQVPELNVLELPFLFRNYEEADHVIDTVLTKQFETLFPKYGFVLVVWGENGYRNFGTKDKFVKSPADLKGKKMRSQESPIHLQTWKSFGAAPVPIPTTETYTALSSGTVDGFDNSTLFSIAANWSRTVKYYTVSNHIYQPAVIALNKAWYDKLPPDLQKIVIDEGRKIQAKGRKLVRKIQPELIDVLRSQGVQIYELTDADRATFDKQAESVRTWFKKTQGKTAAKLLAAVEKSLAAYRKK